MLDFLPDWVWGILGPVIMVAMFIAIFFIFPSPPGEKKLKKLKKESVTSNYLLLETLLGIIFFMLSSGWLSITIPWFLGFMIFMGIRARIMHVRKQNGKLLDEREQIYFWRAGCYAGFALLLEIGFTPLLMEKYKIVFPVNFEMALPFYFYWLNYAISAFVLFRMDENGGKLFGSKSK